MEETYYGLFSLNLTFSTYNEYRTKRRIIVDAYNDMTYKEKVIYRCYVYSRPLLKEYQKDIIWEEINDFKDWLYEGNNERNDR